MGQCVSRNSMAPYAAVHPYNDSVHNSIYSISTPPVCQRCQQNAGQSDSKGARKRSTTPSGRGASMSFGFKKKGHKDTSGSSISREIANPAVRLAASDKNGNGGSKEELFTGSPILSGRSTPLARPRKESSGQPLRTNRFGFRQTTIPKIAKVADVNMSAEQAFHASLQEHEYKNNNTAKESSNLTSGLIPTQIGSNGMANINTPPKPATTKQTIILTYSSKQYTNANHGANMRSKSPAIPNRVTTYHTAASPRSVSASRVYSSSSGYDGGNYRTGNHNNKYTLQSNQLPRVQYPSVKLLETKFDKQVANNTKKGSSASSDGSSKEGSTTGDSGVGGDPADRAGWSPRSSRRLRRPRTLEMVMRGEHTFHLRELQVSDLDIMDEAIVTDVDVIPLPKLPSNFEKDKSTDPDYPPFNRFSSLLGSATEPSSAGNHQNRSHLSTLERYRSNRDRDRLPSVDNESDRDEEKASKDRLQCEKDFSKMSSSSQFATSLTRNSSKESSPSTKSEESHPSAGSEPMVAWVNQNAGESMALRSNDDISAALSLSLSCDEDKSTKSSPADKNQPMTNFFPQTRIEVVNKSETSSAIRDYAKLSQHPLMINSFTLSQASPLQSMFMSTSMSSSAFSAGSDSQQFNLLAQDPQAALAALAGSNQSMIDDETSPADSLISSSSESNNEMPLLEKDTTVSSSAYHTADNKTIENLQEEKEVCEEAVTKENGENEKTPSAKQSPRTPGTPSNSLSLSEGRDFLIDDEIADQPALIFESNSTAEQMTSSLQLLNLNNATDNTATLQEQNDSPMVNKKNKGLQNSQKVQSSPSCVRRVPVPPARSPSLDTLSPCDSIASDDLICDMDLNNSLTSLNSQDEYIDRLDGSIRSGLNALEDAQLREELMRFSVKRQQSHTQTNGDCGQSHHSTPIKHQTPSTSNSSIANIGAALPARTARLLGRSRASTPEAVVKPRGLQSTPPGPPPPDDNVSLRLERATHGSMQQDIVSIKAMLLKLKRVLQEPEEGLNLTRTETLNPLDIQGSPLKYGPSLHLGEEGEASPPPPPPAPHEEVADLKRQLVFLQSQLEERERMVKLLQQQMNKYSEGNSPNGEHKCNGVNAEEMCNVATQTERLRPLSQGPNMLQGLNSESHPGGLVSWNEKKTPRKLTASLNDYCNNSPSLNTPISRLKKPNNMVTSSPMASSPATHNDSNIGRQSNNNSYSISHSRSNNSINKQDISNNNSAVVTDNGVQLKVNCRVGSRYLQAISNKNIDNKGDTSFSQRTVRSRSLHASRSKSIENFHNKTTCASGSNISTPVNGLRVFNNKATSDSDSNLVQNKTKMHHNSFNNLHNGCVSDSNESDSSRNNNNDNKGNDRGLSNNGFNHNNGNSTDTDDNNSDSGYKSLPPSINKNVIMNGSGIPRSINNVDFRFSSSKQAQSNKC